MNIHPDMNRELRYKYHQQFCSDWMKCLENSSYPDLLGCLQKAVDALYSRSKTSVSELTLAVVFDRVIYNSSERFPLLSMLKVEKDRIDFHGLKERTDLSTQQVRDAFQYFITEFLFVIGNLTGEQLTPLLHNTLQEIKPTK